MLLTQAVRHRLLMLAPQALRRRTVLRKLGHLPFAVISNNCWGSHIYQAAGLPYATPFIGLAMSPKSYLRLLSNWNFVKAPLRFKGSSSEEWVENIRQARGTFWPVGFLADQVEIQFMHYQSEEEARVKWERRLQRMPADPGRLFVKFDDYDRLSDNELSQFATLEFPNKVFFSGNSDRLRVHCAMYIPTSTGRLPDGLTLSRISPQYFDAASWIGGRQQPCCKLLSSV